MQQQIIKEIIVGDKVYSPVILHPLVSKGMLAHHFNCSLKYLRRHIMSDTALSKMKIHPQRYRKVHSGYFTPAETKIIYEHLKITHLLIN